MVRDLLDVDLEEIFDESFLDEFDEVQTCTGAPRKNTSRRPRPELREKEIHGVEIFNKAASTFDSKEFIIDN